MALHERSVDDVRRGRSGWVSPGLAVFATSLCCLLYAGATLLVALILRSIGPELDRDHRLAPQISVLTAGFGLAALSLLVQVIANAWTLTTLRRVSHDGSGTSDGSGSGRGGAGSTAPRRIAAGGLGFGLAALVGSLGSLVLLWMQGGAGNLTVAWMAVPLAGSATWMASMTYRLARTADTAHQVT